MCLYVCVHICKCTCMCGSKRRPKVDTGYLPHLFSIWFLKVILLCIWVCVYVSMYCMHVLYPQKSDDVIGFPATTVQMIVNGTQDLWKCSHYSIFPVPSTLFFKYRVCNGICRTLIHLEWLATELPVYMDISWHCWLFGWVLESKFRSSSLFMIEAVSSWPALRIFLSQCHHQKIGSTWFCLPQETRLWFLLFYLRVRCPCI